MNGRITRLTHDYRLIDAYHSVVYPDITRFHFGVGEGFNPSELSEAQFEQLQEALKAYDDTVTDHHNEVAVKESLRRLYSGSPLNDAELTAKVDALFVSMVHPLPNGRSAHGLSYRPEQAKRR